MRPKITFRDTRQKRCFWGISSPDDADLDADLASSLAMWRAKYYRFNPRTYKPLRKDVQEQFKELTLAPLQMDVRATLQALEKIPDDQANDAVRWLDSDTYARIKHAAYQDYRRSNPTGKIPPSDLRIREVSNGRAVLAISPQRLRELATLALSASTPNNGGRPRINSLDYLFACALVRYWKSNEQTKPTAQDGSKFMEWVSDMFRRIGVPREDHAKVLKKAIRDINKMG